MNQPSTHARVRGEVVSLRHVGADFWGIATVETASDGAVAVTGKLIGIELGDSVDASGTWSEHPKFGRQMKAKEIVVTVPASSAGIVAWMMARIPGLGRARATECVTLFGVERVWAVIENEPDRLCEIKGITPDRRDVIVAAYRQYSHERDRMVALRGWGLTDNQIARAMARWGDKVEENLRADPYRLAWEVAGFGFVRADEVASRMGVPKDAPGRVRAGLTHVMGEAKALGHCYVSTGKLAEMTARLLGLTAKACREGIASLPEERVVVRGGRVFIAEIAAAEDCVCEAVAMLLRAG